MDIVTKIRNLCSSEVDWVKEAGRTFADSADDLFDLFELRFNAGGLHGGFGVGEQQFALGAAGSEDLDAGHGEDSFVGMMEWWNGGMMEYKRMESWNVGIMKWRGN